MVHRALSEGSADLVRAQDFFLKAVTTECKLADQLATVLSHMARTIIVVLGRTAASSS